MMGVMVMPSVMIVRISLALMLVVSIMHAVVVRV
jgi:hypothetical protein